MRKYLLLPHLAMDGLDGGAEGIMEMAFRLLTRSAGNQRQDLRVRITSPCPYVHPLLSMLRQKRIIRYPRSSMPRLYAFLRIN